VSKHRLILTVTSLMIAAVILACSDSQSPDGANDGPGDELKVVATTTQIGDFARNVGGDRIDLTVLLSPNQDAHDFELEPSQLRAVVEADLILRNGLGLDSFLDSALQSSEATVATLSDGIDALQGAHEGNDEQVDPHVWLSVANARRMVENLREALIAEDTARAEEYRQNAAAYLQALDALDASIRGEVEAVPAGCRKLVTNHDVLGYYASAYGFEVVGSIIPSTTAAAQASAAAIREIVTLVEAENVPAIFAEASINPALVEQVGREAGVTVIDDLYGDSLGPEGSDGATYIEMMRSNTRKIVAALRDC
jgi:manganese/iron transport system substrate-binding protein